MSAQRKLGDLEIWVLNAIALRPLPVEYFALSIEDFERHTNVKHCGAARFDIFNALVALGETRFIDTAPSVIEDTFHRVKDLEHLCSTGCSAELGLTKVGSRAWERAAQPNWCKYNSVEMSVDASGTETLSVSAATVEGVRRSLAFFCFSNFFVPLSAVPPNIYSESPFHVTYWKCLPEGFTTKVAVYRQVQWLQFWATDEFFNSDILKWYTDVCSRTHPEYPESGRRDNE